MISASRIPSGGTGSGGGGIEVLGAGAASLLAGVAGPSLGADGLRIGRGFGAIAKSRSQVACGLEVGDVKGRETGSVATTPRLARRAANGFTRVSSLSSA